MLSSFRMLVLMAAAETFGLADAEVLKLIFQILYISLELFTLDSLFLVDFWLPKPQNPTLQSNQQTTIPRFG